MSEWADLYWTSEDGLRLHARDYPAASGDARLPVVCIHGLTRNAKDFDHLAPHLAATGRRAIAVDVRGRGLSARGTPETYQLPTYARDIEALAAALGMAEALFVGTSMGGLITMELATRSPRLIRGAILNDVGPVLSAEGLGRIAGYVGRGKPLTSWQDAAEQLRLTNGAALPHYREEDWLAMARRTCREQDGTIVPDYDPDIAKAFGSAALGTDPHRSWAALAHHRPILLLRGALSDLLDQDAAETMVTGRPNARLQIVAGVGHAPMLDEPDALAAIDAFLAELP